MRTILRFVGASFLLLVGMSCDVGMSVQPGSLEAALVIDQLVYVPVDADSSIRRDQPNRADGLGVRLLIGEGGRGRALVHVNDTEIAAAVALGTLHSAWLEIAVAGNDGRGSDDALSAHPLAVVPSPQRLHANRV